MVIQAENLTRYFGGIKAVDGLTFSVNAGEVFGMLGPNGAGKTTTVRLINGLLAPTSGTIRALGLDPVSQGDKVRAQTGVLTETPSLYERLSARDNLLLFGKLYRVPSDKLAARVDAVLADLGLSARANDKAGGYSKGMKQRLAIARALLHEPQILFLDEPTAGLDPEAARHVTELIEQLSRERGRTVLLCTHNLNEAQRLCDRVAVMNQGRILALGSPKQLGQELWRSIWVDIELRSTPTESLLNALQNSAGVKEVKLDTLTLAVQLDAEDAIPNTVAQIAALGGQIMRVNPREHSLEEIYFELQKQNR